MEPSDAPGLGTLIWPPCCWEPLHAAPPGATSPGSWQELVAQHNLLHLMALQLHTSRTRGSG